MLKKVLLVLLAGIGGYFAYKKTQQSRAEQGPLGRGRRPGQPPATDHPHGGVAQLAEHCLCKAGVRGSSPLVSTTPRRIG